MIYGQINAKALIIIETEDKNNTSDLADKNMREC